MNNSIIILISILCFILVVMVLYKNYHNNYAISGMISVGIVSLSVAIIVWNSNNGKGSSDKVVNYIGTNIGVGKGTDKPTILPVFIITTNGWKPEKYKEKHEAQLTVTSNIIESNYSKNKMTMSVRGQSSASFAKKQWNIKFDKKTHLLDFPKSKKYILQGPYMDKSLIRNKLMYELGTELGLYSPKIEFVELFLNTSRHELDLERDYWGVYLLIESIPDDYNDNEYSFSFDKIKQDNTRFYLPKVNENDPSKTGNAFILNNSTDVNGLKSIIEKFQNSLFSDTFEYEYTKYIDVDSFIIYYILTELSNDVDSYRWSTNLYVKDGKIFMGYLWDFNGALWANDMAGIENHRYFKTIGQEGGQYMSSDGGKHTQRNGAANWFYRLMKSRKFSMAVVNKLDSLVKGELSSSKLQLRIRSYLNMLTSNYVIKYKNKYKYGLTPESRNFNKWNVLPYTKFSMPGGWSMPTLNPPPLCYSGGSNYVLCDINKPNELENYSAIGRVFVFMIARLDWMVKNL